MCYKDEAERGKEMAKDKSQHDFRAFKGARNCATFVMNGARCEYYTRDFKIGHYGRLGRLDRCHVTQKTRDLLPSSFWDGMFSPGFSS